MIFTLGQIVFIGISCTVSFFVGMVVYHWNGVGIMTETAIAIIDNEIAETISLLDEIKN